MSAVAGRAADASEEHERESRQGEDQRQTIGSFDGRACVQASAPFGGAAGLGGIDRATVGVGRYTAVGIGGRGIGIALGLGARRLARKNPTQENVSSVSASVNSDAAVPRS